MDGEEVWRLFAPHLIDRVSALERGLRLVHYTSVESAYRIITGRQVWLRNASMMNDFSEIEHGISCLNTAWGSPGGKQLQEMLNRIAPGLRDTVEGSFNEHANLIRSETFIISLSEHDDNEDETGRLSMWRAYGGRAGIALVMNNVAFRAETDVMKVFSSPVFYLSAETFSTWFQQWAGNLVAAEGVLREEGPEFVRAWLFDCFRGFALCTKHPGFHEEREWRVYTSPRLEGPSDWLEPAIEIVGGIPQRLMKLKLFDDLEREITGVSPATLIDRVIIGPCEHPIQVRDAIWSALTEAGVPDAEHKIWMSLIPLRQ